jgi:hypothetical protein
VSRVAGLSIRDRAADLGRNRVHRRIEKAFRALG